MTFKKITLALLALLTACEPFVDNRGFNHETLDIQKVIVGADTKEIVREKFGSPSSESTFPLTPGTKQTQWYYITKRTSTNAFFAPTTLLQQTVYVTFNDAGIVTEVKKLEGENVIEMSKSKTESSGYETNAGRDIFGNFGRYGVNPSVKKTD